eukprot:8599204-Lingulodinium_polyedra.AAC.1
MQGRGPETPPGLGVLRVHLVIPADGRRAALLGPLPGKTRLRLALIRGDQDLQHIDPTALLETNAPARAVVGDGSTAPVEAHCVA